MPCVSRTTIEPWFLILSIAIWKKNVHDHIRLTFNKKNFYSPCDEMRSRMSNDKGLNDLAEMGILAAEIKHGSFCRFIEIASVRRCRCRSHDKCTANVAASPDAAAHLLIVSLVGFSLRLYIYIYTYMCVWVYICAIHIYGYNDPPRRRIARDCAKSASTRRAILFRALH